MFTGLFNFPVSIVDKFLDKLTSYRLMLYFLIVLLFWGIGAAFFDQVAYSPIEIALSASWLVVIGVGANYLLAKYFNVAKNNESDYISSLILALILSPADDLKGYLILAVAVIMAMASKYVLVLNRWHIFNPAAFGAVVAGFVFDEFPSWWVGTDVITPIIILGGWLVLRKMKRYIMATVFITTALVIIALNVYLNQDISAVDNGIWLALVSSPLLFFAFVMLTEPLTSPRHKRNYVPYAFLVAFLYAYTKLRISPEQAILIGNAFTYLFEPNKRMELHLKKTVKEAAGLQSFVFSGKKNFRYDAGQYMEWTIEGSKSDTRGNRRYLTIASSPTEKELMITVKMPEKPSSFKRKLSELKKDDPLLAGQLSGEFTLPKSERQKIAFLAGGIGVTPFRSMAKYMLDFNQERDVHLLYSANSEKEFAYKELFADAKKAGLVSTYLTDHITSEVINEYIPDYIERIFYISGPYAFVKAQEKNLDNLGIPKSNIKIDYFPGYN
jgi:glycine betaine catabolism B